MRAHVFLVSAALLFASIFNGVYLAGAIIEPDGPIYIAQGTASTKNYKRSGELFEQSEGPIQYSFSKTWYATKFHPPSEILDFKAVTINDGTDVFQSQILQQLRRGGAQVNVPRITVGRIDGRL